MKAKITIAVDAETLEQVDDSVKAGKFRNRSHAFEYSVRKVNAEVG